MCKLSIKGVKLDKEVMVSNVVSIVVKAMLIVGGAILLAMLASSKPAAAKETMVSYDGMLLVPGKTQESDVLAWFETEKVSRRVYNILLDGEPVAVVKFNKNKCLKSVKVCDTFLNGAMGKECAPSYSNFGKDLEEMGLMDANSTVTGSRTPYDSEMSIKKNGVKISWNYALTNDKGNLSGKVTSCMYHAGEWYVLVKY